MANALTNLNHTLLAQRVLEGFTAAMAPITGFANDYSADAAARGDKVKVLYVGGQDDAVDFTGTYTMQDADAEGLDISLNKHKFTSWGLTDKEIWEKPQLEVERFMRQKGFRLGKAVFQDILSIITAANYGNATGDVTTVTAANFDLEEVIDLSIKADNKDFPEMDRVLMLKPAYHGAIRKDINPADVYGSDEVIRRGVVGSVDTFSRLYKSNLIPANSESLEGFAGHPDAILTAMRYHRPQDGHDYAIAEPVTDPDTGMTLGLRGWYDRDTGTMKMVMEAVYGYRVGVPTGIVRIKSA